jgi:uncharacterized protein (TIGR02145 family)
MKSEISLLMDSTIFLFTTKFLSITSVSSGGSILQANDETISGHTDYLGGEAIAGGKLKDTGYDHWEGPNKGADNSSGFTSLPGGYGNYDFLFYNVYYNGNWWSSTEYGTNLAWFRDVYYHQIVVLRNYFDKNGGLSVRCLKDD